MPKLGYGSPHAIIHVCCCVLRQAILIGPGVEGGIDEQQLLANFRDDTWSNTCVMLLRFITSAEIKRRVDHFEPFVVVSVAQSKLVRNNTNSGQTTEPGYTCHHMHVRRHRRCQVEEGTCCATTYAVLSCSIPALGMLFLDWHVVQFWQLLLAQM